MAQVQKYVIERVTGVAANADTGQIALDPLLPVKDSVVLGLEIDISATMQTAAGGVTIMPTEEEAFQFAERVLGTVQFNDSLFGMWINGSLGDLLRSAFVVHGRRPQLSFRGLNAAAFGVAGSVVQRLNLFLPFSLPVGRESLPGSMGGRGSKSALPTVGQLTRGGGTFRRVAGTGGLFSFGGLADWTISAASIGITVNAVCAAEQGAGGRTNSPLQYVARSLTQGTLILDAGDHYGIHARGQTANAVATSALEATVDGALLFESGRFNALDNINQVNQAYRHGGDTPFAGDPGTSTYVPIVYPDPIDHGPVRCASKLQLTNFQGAWSNPTFFACYVKAFDMPLIGTNGNVDTSAKASLVAPTLAGYGPTAAPLRLY